MLQRAARARVARSAALTGASFACSQAADKHTTNATKQTEEGTRNGGNRYATVLMYLATTEEGGETVFPNVAAPGGDNGPGYSDCARHHLAA